VFKKIAERVSAKVVKKKAGKVKTGG